MLKYLNSKRDSSRLVPFPVHQFDFYDRPGLDLGQDVCNGGRVESQKENG